MNIHNSHGRGAKASHDQGHAERSPEVVRHSMPFGAEVMSEGVRFRLWALACSSVQLAIEGARQTLRMQALADGWHELVTAQARAGTRYRYVVNDDLRVPDPASRFQPEDVHGLSEVIDPAQYRWQTTGWRGRPWREAIVYELHVGTYTPEGTFLAIIGKLDHLVALGVTAIQLMPIADFPGSRNWGYDGVLLYAPDSTYGRPEDLKMLIDAAHERGLMVLLDVVYNHFGPDGNYLSLYAPKFFTLRHNTPWGAAVNYDGESSTQVRGFVIHNALYWLEEFNLDGLRLDAVHQSIDDSAVHLLDELSERARKSIPHRTVHLILENEHNQASRLERNREGVTLHYNAQWNDDLHHVLHTAVTGERTGYYSEYTGDTEKLARALAEGFAFQGETMRYSGRARGEPSAHLTPQAFVAFIQNHDQVGNRALGERLSVLAPTETLRAIAAVYLLLPQTPMLFMGEEWATTRPFPFFCDFSGDLACAVREGRRQEFASFPEFQDPQSRSRIPDPQADSIFLSAKLDWGESSQSPQADWLKWYQAILRVRKDFLVPRLDEITQGGRYRVLGASAVSVRWQMSHHHLVLDANLSSVPVQADASVGSVLWLEGAANDEALSPWSVRWRVEKTEDAH